MKRQPLRQRPRRNRRTPALRDLVAETSLNVRQMIYPIFVCEGKEIISPIKTMPGISRFSLDKLIPEIEDCLKLGIRSFALFPKIDDGKKDASGSQSLKGDDLVPETVRRLKKEFKDIVLFTDIALDPYSSDGHDGIVRDGEILNDETIEVLSKMAVVHAQAGADFVSPSDMMDGRVAAIRDSLDKNGFQNTGIMAYSAKYASGFYGPFRDALDSAPRAGDKKTYQMDYRNSREAIRETLLDVSEGADIVMVKPALSYLDIIAKVKPYIKIPLAAYNVSGEYALIKSAGQHGMDSEKLMLEVLLSIRRAGADVILTYFAKDFARV